VTITGAELKWLGPIARGVQSVWRFLGRRVTIELSVAYHQHHVDRPLEKMLTITIHNRTGKETALCGFAYERDDEGRKSRHAHERPIVIRHEMMTIAAGRSRTFSLMWQPSNCIHPEQEHFGILIRGYRKIWAPVRQWKRVRCEYMADFPNWAQHPRNGTRVEFKQYGWMAVAAEAAKPSILQNNDCCSGPVGKRAAGD